MLIILKGNNKMWVFQEEIFGLVVCVIIFKDEVEVIEIVNDIFYGLGVGVWICDMYQVYQIFCVVEVGCVWVNNYYVYLVYVLFGGYKKLGIGWEIYKMMFVYYCQIKNMLIFYDKKVFGFFQDLNW